jgi:hypothetical protein
LFQVFLLPALHLNSVIVEQFLKFADVGQHAGFFALQLLKVASPFGTAGNTVGDAAFEVEGPTL